jgi:hypothetical protein
MTVWIVESPEALEACGFIPDLFDDADPRPAVEQANDRYGFAGGWNPIPGFELHDDKLCYPGDPPMAPLAYTALRETGEIVVIFQHGLVLVRQDDGTLEVARLD